MMLLCPNVQANVMPPVGSMSKSLDQFVFGMAPRIAQLRNLIDNDENVSEANLQSLLRKNDWSVARAANAFFEYGLQGESSAPVEIEMVELGSKTAASETAASVTSSSSSVKRQRGSSSVTTGDLPTMFRQASEPLTAEESERQAVRDELYQTLMQPLIQHLNRLPTEVARAIPGAVREHDQREAARLSANAERSADAALEVPHRWLVEMGRRSMKFTRRVINRRC